MQWRTASGEVDLDRPVFLGILNITPDSFSDGGCHEAPSAALAQAEQLVRTGAAALDLGAESTRPGASPVSPGEEWERLRPVLSLLRQHLPQCPLSLDTRNAQVAERGLGQGASIVNDVTGFTAADMLALVRGSTCGLIAMRSRLHEGRIHMPEYGSGGKASAGAAIEELRAIKAHLLEAGIVPERILLDPGFGFGTTYAEDLALWQALPDLPELLDWPAARICIAVSRKRFLAWRAGTPELPPRERDGLTHQAHAQAMMLGYRVFRTHAVGPL